MRVLEEKTIERFFDKYFSFHNVHVPSTLVYPETDSIY